MLLPLHTHTHNVSVWYLRCVHMCADLRFRSIWLLFAGCSFDLSFRLIYFISVHRHIIRMWTRKIKIGTERVCVCVWHRVIAKKFQSKAKINNGPTFHVVLKIKWEKRQMKEWKWKWHRRGRCSQMSLTPRISTWSSRTQLVDTADAVFLQTNNNQNASSHYNF